MSAALTAAVVLPTHRRGSFLRPVLEAVLADPATSELVVVVDGADPVAESLLADLARGDARVRHLVLEPSAGTARAKLAGARAAQADVLVLLDDDVEAGPGLVSRHLQWHREQASLVVVGAMPVQAVATRSRLDGLAALLYQRNYEATCRAYAADPAQVLEGLWGGNLSVRRLDYLRLAEEVLRFPRVAHEDQHFGLVARRAGLRGVYDPAAGALHLHRRTWDGMLREAQRQGRGQRALHLVHGAHVPFDADALPEPLHPWVAQVVLHSDRPAWRAAFLLALRLSTAAALRAGRERLAVRLAFAATQVARRQGRRDPEVDRMVDACAAATPSGPGRSAAVATG